MENIIKVINYFNSEDLKEQNDLANQIEFGEYDQELSELNENEINSLIIKLRNNDDLNRKELEVLKKINHIGAFLILSLNEI